MASAAIAMPVAPAAERPVVESLEVHAGGEVTVRWSGGDPPFRVQCSTDLREWETAGPVTQETVQTVDRMVVDLFPWDAGTEEGTAFSLSNPATEPREPIRPIGEAAAFATRPPHEAPRAVARFVFERNAPPSS